MTRRGCGAALAAMLALFAAAARADTYPARIVRMVVPQAAGGTTDVLARAVAARLAERWRQGVVVENVVGASGNLGIHQVARAEPDGYTLLMTYEGSQAMNPHVLPPGNFDPVRDFAPVAAVARAPFVLVAGRKAPATFAEMVARARAAPDALTYGSAGIGSANHVIGELLKKRAEIQVRHVPYRGAAQATTDVIAGQIDLAVLSIPSVIGLVAGGEVRPLAVTGARRSEALPDVPTAAEAGLSGFDVTPWWGVLAPARTDPALVRRIGADIDAVLDLPEIRDTLRRQGAEVFKASPEEFGRLLAADYAKWGAAVKDMNLR